MKIVFPLLFCCCLAFISTGCRYTHESPGEKGRSPFGMGSIKNSTLENEITPVIRREVIRQLAARAPLNVVDAREGIPRLSGTITRYKRESLRSDDDARSAEFRVVMQVEFVLHAPSGEEQWRKNITGEGTFAAGAGQELSAQKEAVDDMVIKLIHALFPAW